MAVLRRYRVNASIGSLRHGEIIEIDDRDRGWRPYIDRGWIVLDDRPDAGSARRAAAGEAP